MKPNNENDTTTEVETTTAGYNSDNNIINYERQTDDSQVNSGREIIINEV